MASLTIHSRNYGESMLTSTDSVTLRKCALAVSVLADIDLLPRDDGVLVTTGTAASRQPGADAVSAGAGEGTVLVDWSDVAEATGGHDPLSVPGRTRVATLLRLYRLVANHGTGSASRARDRIRAAARALALPPGHALHPGPGWVRQQVRGGVLDLGIGVLGLTESPSDLHPLPPSLADNLGLHPLDWWPDLLDHLERMGGLAATRICVNGRPVLRPVGGCDALTLLAAPSLREELAGGDGSGLRAVAVPTRLRGWFDLAQIDPAYTAAAWSITAEVDRGLPAPALVSRDEVTLPAPGGDVIGTSLDDPRRKTDRHH